MALHLLNYAQWNTLSVEHIGFYLMQESFYISQIEVGSIVILVSFWYLLQKVKHLISEGAVPQF